MSTLGVVSVQQDGEVMLKIAVYEDGYYAQFAAEDILDLGRVPTVEEAYNIADKYHFGGRDTMIVISPTEVVYRGKARLAKDEEEFRERCRRTFDRPGYNPWDEEGTEITEYAEVVSFFYGQEPRLSSLGIPADPDRKPFIKESTAELDDALEAYRVLCTNLVSVPEPQGFNMASSNVDFGAGLTSMILDSLSFSPVENAIVNTCQSKENAVFAADYIITLMEDLPLPKDRFLASAGRIVNRLQEKFKNNNKPDHA